MTWRFYHQCCLLICAGLVAAGCGSTRFPRGGRLGATPEDAGRAEAETQARAESQAHFGRAVVHDMNGEADAAARHYEQAGVMDPGDAWLVLEVSRRLLHHKKTEQALRVLEAAQARSEVTGEELARLAEVYTRLGQPERGIEASRNAIRKAPLELTGYQTLFTIQVQQNLPEEAFRILEEASRQSKADGEFLTGLAELYIQLTVQAPALRTNATTRALGLLRRAETVMPTNVITRLKMADGFYLLGDSAKAAEVYLQALEAMGEIPFAREHIHAKLAEIYLRSSDRSKAFEQLESIVKENPTNPQAYYYLGVIAQEEKRYGQAADYFGKAVLLNPDFEAGYYDLAMARLSAEQPAKCLETLDQARRKFPPNYLMELLSGLAFSQQKDYSAALRYFTAAEVIANATNPRFLTHVFYFQLGAAQERVKKYEEAARSFEKCLEMSPDFAEALNYLGYMWADMGINLTQSLAVLEKAVKLEPDNPAFLDSLGWVLFKLNRPREALQAVRRAVELSTEPDPTLYLHLGDIYLELKRTQEAREAYQKSLGIEANDDLQRKLDGLPKD